MTLELALIAITAVLAVALVGALMTVRRSADEARALRSRMTILAADLAAAETHATRLPQTEAEVRNLRLILDRERAAKLTAQNELKSLHLQHDARLEELTLAKQELEDRFAALAGKVLNSNSENLLKIVSERFSRHSTEAREDLSKRQQAIEDMVKPLGERLGKFDEKIGQIEKARSEAYGQIRQQVQQLHLGHGQLAQETSKLVQALRRPKTRGRWGEMQLRQVFELAGMSENVDFDLEQHHTTDDGAKRPDAVVRIPGGKSIVVDAKTPLEAYLDALDADTEQDQAAAMTRHAAQVKAHVQQLSSKEYQSLLTETPDFVVMFIPGENFVASAVDADPNLIEFAFEKKVLIATPTTLMALVKAIAYGWQQEKMAENAVEVQKTARELYDRLSTFSGHLGKIGKSLNSSVDSYNKAVGSLEKRVLPSARKFEAMGVVPPQTTLAQPDPVDAHSTPLSAPEIAEAPAE